MVIAEIVAAIEGAGLAYLGAFGLEAGEKPEGVKTVALVGMAGATNWPAFAASPEAVDGLAHPLDRFSRRVIGGLADKLGGSALFPFEGPPYWPFQAWARRAGPVFVSPIKLLIHADHGLWLGYRGALGFAAALDLPPQEARANPCETCVGRPCLGACPVEAFDGAGYDWAACGAHLRGEAPSECLRRGCLARRACPVGEPYTPEHAGFHAQAIVKGFA